MSKIHRGNAGTDGEPLSAGRVEYLEAARQRVRSRRLRRTAIILVALTLVILFATGVVGTSIARVKDLVDTVHIALTPSVGWPQQTGLADLTAVQSMSGSFVAMDEDTCVVYSLRGSRLNSIQSGYARPALAAGKTRFVLYNRSGNELRVESRTQNLYTKTLEDNIYLCAMSDNGRLAVATDSTDSAARLTVYSSSMREQLHWDMTSEQGTPLRMAFSTDSRRLAVAAVTSSAGQLQTNLYLVNLAQGDPVQLSSESSVPQWLDWLSADTLLAVYENCAVVYDANGSERGRYDFSGGTLVSVSATSSGLALLLENGQVCTVALLDKGLTVQYSGNVPSSHQVVRTQSGFYLLTDTTVEVFNSTGEFQWDQTFAARPQALVNGKQPVVLCGNTAQPLTQPEPAASSAS